jgi:hypothetical protein
LQQNQQHKKKSFRHGVSFFRLSCQARRAPYTSCDFL